MKRDTRAVEHALSELDRRHLRRSRRTIEKFPQPQDGSLVVVDGRRLINFCGNDYLGLARHPAVAAAMSEAALLYGSGSGASHLVTGHGIEHERLEEELAAFTGRERALLFSTGYMANLAAISCLSGRGDLVLLDRLSHASLIDAGLLSGARIKRYAHCDASAVRGALARSACAARAGSSGVKSSGIDGFTRRLADRLTEETQGKPFDEDLSGVDQVDGYSGSSRSAVVATDGVFSMDGDLAPLPALAEAAHAQHAWLVVDDAHGLGVLGETGRGTLEHFQLDATSVPVLVGTLGKAFGSFGAFIAGSADLIEWLLQKARTYIYTTALPQPVAAATRASLRVMQSESWRREKVLALTARFREAAHQQGIPLLDSITPIQPIVMGSAEQAVNASRILLDAGFWVAAIRPPTVPSGTARLRVTFSAAHTESQVDALVDALSRVCRTAARETIASAS